MPSYLVVANRTLGGPELLDAIRQRMGRGPATFWVLVPATPSTHLLNDVNALSGAFPLDPRLLVDPGEGADEASRLRTEVEHLRAIGATAAGAVGDADPLRAIDAVLAERTFDEIILSTLPAGLSRWLTLDLPRRVRRRTDVPLTVVTTRDGESERPPPGASSS